MRQLCVYGRADNVNIDEVTHVTTDRKSTNQNVLNDSTSVALSTIRRLTSNALVCVGMFSWSEWNLRSFVLKLMTDNAPDIAFAFDTFTPGKAPTIVWPCDSHALWVGFRDAAQITHNSTAP